ncbi:glycosyl hydrolase family 47 [Ancylostoma duodenale]|uniref:Glycosyl hydrolase family 47 n=1 Tax=Ancylostoma duodenale TaxID=51022 RepID=A0A0C2GG32_9BILA|nr:glycosyl hydrolase family 47 [Ancylostoma duodenale]
MKTRYASNYGWANGGSSILAEFGSLHLEFIYLSHIAKAPIFAKKVKKIRDVLDRMEKVNGLYSNYVNSDTGRFTRSYHMSLGALGDSFYEYLIKSWLQSGKMDDQARAMYWEVSKAMREQNSENGYILRPEVIEGFFYLWRLTGKQVRVQAAVAPGRRSLISNRGRDDVQQSFFLAETLKYAYLTFTDNSVMPLDKWVFNTEAHPLPVMN